jgi:xylulokinase
MPLSTIRAGDANMFMSDIFSASLANISGAHIELYDTDGALGAARGAGVGAGIFSSLEEAFATLEKKKTIIPDGTDLTEAYGRWKSVLEKTV